MKKLAFLVLFLVVSLALLGAEGQYETVGAMKSLPAGVQTQSRFGQPTPANFQEFDKSGDVKFLQVQHTAPASPSKHGSYLDGSLGERIIEVQAQPNISASAVEWTVKNKGPNAVYVVAAGMKGAGFNRKIAAGETASFTIPVDGSRYSYIVLDSEGGKKTEASITAKMGGTDAKTVRGKSMKVLWF